MRSACVWCREALPAFAATPPACPTCGKELRDTSGERLRPIDVGFEGLLAEADATTSKWVRRSFVFAACAALLGIVPSPLSAAAFLVLLVGQFFFARFLIARRYARHFAPHRRLVTRWLTRLFLLVVVAPLHGAALAIPVLGVALAAGIFGGTCWAFRAYFRFHFLREHRREGILFVEKVFLVVLAFLFVALLVLFALALWLGLWTLDQFR